MSLSLSLLFLLTAVAQWSWTDASGAVRSADDLQSILDEHARWLESGGAQGKRASLRRARLSGADLSRARLSRAVLGIADLSRSNLQGADFSKANFWMARLSSARLSGADLSGALLVDAVLRDSDLSQAKLIAANLRRANLKQATLKGSDIRFANLAFSVGITSGQVQQAQNWRQAYYDQDMLSELGLAEDHNKKLAEKHRQEDPASYQRLFGK